MTRLVLALAVVLAAGACNPPRADVAVSGEPAVDEPTVRALSVRGPIDPGAISALTPPTTTTTTTTTAPPPPTTTTTAPPPPTTTTTAAPVVPATTTPAVTYTPSTGALGDPYYIGSWHALRECEAPDWAGGWQANTGNGYYGGLQFALASWQAVGGAGYPHEASVDEQIRRGQMLWERQGWGAWPACSRKLGWR